MMMQSQFSIGSGSLNQHVNLNGGGSFSHSPQPQGYPSPYGAPIMQSNTVNNSAPPEGADPRNINSGSKLFVGQVPSVCTEELLYPLFAPYGKILEVKVMRDFIGRSKGSAWVRYESQQMAQTAIDALHEKHTIPPQTHPLRVQFASPSNPNRARPAYPAVVSRAQPAQQYSPGIVNSTNQGYNAQGYNAQGGNVMVGAPAQTQPQQQYAATAQYAANPMMNAMQASYQIQPSYASTPSGTLYTGTSGAQSAGTQIVGWPQTIQQPGAANIWNPSQVSGGAALNHPVQMQQPNQMREYWMMNSNGMSNGM